jgi:hypothetical protein
MKKGTSGFWLTEKDGSISIGYEDYGVSEFGGGDFEKTYTLDKENSEKFIAALKTEYSGSLEDMIETAFTRNFSDRKFWDFCKAHSIKFLETSWSN